ncbi:nuclear transport factor 2 family protein [Kitasatospora sp. NPDC052868]|uniref:nuclear transport factor 2 family protein n=1 Tax=Kitasatospora sp. NPDC052868 TaxID=3364060 RepID=UPI0037C85875
MTDSATDSKNVVLRYLRALRERDIPTVLEVLAEDVEYWIAGDLPISGTWTGREKVLTGFFTEMTALLDPDAEYSIEVRNVIAEAGHVVIECVSSSVTRQGTPFDNPIVAVFTLGGGRITGMREYFDTQNFARAIGVEPAVREGAA